MARRRPRRVTLLVAAAALLVGGGLGWWVRPAAPSPGPLEPVAVRTADPAVVATANLVPHTWGVEIKLTARGLAEGGVYRVVVTDREGNRVPAGEFLGTGAAELRCNLNSSLLRAAAGGFQVLDGEDEVIASAEF
ncbi:hypothetical protein [Crossiella sp. NPDC003009]